MILLTASVAASSTGYSVPGVTSVPEDTVTGQEVTFEVRVKNTGDATVGFTDKSRASLLVNGEVVGTTNLLVDPGGRTQMERYLEVDPGATETLELEWVPKTPGRTAIEARIAGPYLYGGEVRNGNASVEREIAFLNPPVETLDIWISGTDGGIKPSVVIGNGRAYTGELALEVLYGGDNVYNDTIRPSAKNGFSKTIEEEFFRGEGNYTLKATFGG